MHVCVCMCVCVANTALLGTIGRTRGGTSEPEGPKPTEEDSGNLGEAAIFLEGDGSSELVPGPLAEQIKEDLQASLDEWGPGHAITKALHAEVDNRVQVERLGVETI